MASGAGEAAPALPAGMFDRSRLIQWGLAAVTVLLVLGPILPILYQSILDRPLYDTGANLTAGNYLRLVADPSLLGVAWNTLVFAALSTIIATVFGVLAAVLIGRTDVPFRRALTGLFVWPLLISSLVMAFGWIIIFGPAGYATLWVKAATGVNPWSLYSLPGMALVTGVGLAPTTFLYCIGSAAMSDATLEDAARSCGAGPLRTLFVVTLPLMLPAIIYSAVLSFTSAIEALAIPLMLRGNSNVELFTTLLYLRGFASSRPDYGIVATVALVLLVIIVALLMLQNRLLQNQRRFVTIGGKAARPRPLQLGAFRWPLFLLLLAYVVVFTILPVASIVLRASVTILSPLVPFWQYFTWEHVTDMWGSDSNQRAILNTIVVSVVGAAVGTLFVALLSIVIHRSEFRFRGTLQYVALLPRAVPGIVAGMGFFYAMALFPPVGWIRGTIWILMLAYVMRYIPLAYGALTPPLFKIGRDLDNSARVIGADWWTRTTRILLPLIRPAMLSSFALLFVHFLNEYTAAVYLFAPGSEVIGSVLLNAWDRGDAGLLAAFATLQIVITMAFLVLSRLIGIGGRQMAGA